MKKLRSLILATVLLLCSFGALIGCKKGGTDSFIIWWVPGEDKKIELTAALEAFKTENPDFNYDLKPQATSDYRESLKKTLLNDKKNAPDVIISDHSVLQSLGVSGRLLDLAPLGANDIKDLFFETNWKANTYGDKVYGLPLDANCVALMYNARIFKLAGIVYESGDDIPEGKSIGDAKPPKTYEEFLNDCALIKSRGYIPFAFPYVDHSAFSPYMFTAWMARNGAKIIEDDLKTTNLNDEKGVDTLNKIRSLVQSGYAETAWQVSKFFRGEVGMVEMGSWELSQITSDDIEIAEMFTIDPDIPNYSVLGLYSLALTNKCIDPQMGYKLLKYLTTDKTFVKSYTSTIDLFPSLKSLIDEPEFHGKYYDVYNSQIRKTVARPGSPAWEKTQAYIMDAVENAGISMNITTQDLMDELKNKIQAELNRLN